MGKYANTQCADIKYGIGFDTITDLILFSKAIQLTSITHGLNIFYAVLFLNLSLLTRIFHQHWIGIEKTVMSANFAIYKCFDSNISLKFIASIILDYLWFFA